MPKISYQNRNIFYRISGNGPAVFFLHGFGENGDVFFHQVESLKNEFKIIVPDLPGSGQSDRFVGQPGLEIFADVVHEIALKEIPDEKISLFGHSMGGYTTMAFVEKYAGRLNSFGLLHSSAFDDTEEKKDIRKKSIEFIHKNGGQAFLKTITPDLFSEESRSVNPKLISELLALSNNITDEALVQYYLAMVARPDRSGLLKSSSVPVLFLTGKYDKVVPLETAVKQSHLPHASDLQILEHSGHMGIWEEYDQANIALLRFLRNIH